MVLERIFSSAKIFNEKFEWVPRNRFKIGWAQWGVRTRYLQTQEARPQSTLAKTFVISFLAVISYIVMLLYTLDIKLSIVNMTCKS